MMGNI